ncbi:helix-turn-helix domain-containing protein [Alkalinema sp. FACHB-956]|uniref:winged helix-turn-helix transcriptional regulator n=1 Tax=Alkalinema sp. FACHB-956 TaxID=2692768 RepID=UPI0016840132|nr:helix-turn-helix transcriptional regulator [Alkalinema sp. FACHB-956]
MENFCPQPEQHCPIQYTLTVLEGKWALPILRELFSGPKRTHTLVDALPGISTKTLMQRLRSLEKQGLVHRQVYAEVPPHVEYWLTDKGREIQPVLVALYQVGQRWLAQDNCFCGLTHLQSCPSPNPAIPNPAIPNPVAPHQPTPEQSFAV